MPQIKSVTSNIVSILLCRPTPHIFSLNYSQLNADILLQLKKRKRNQPLKVRSFPHTQCCRQCLTRIKSYSIWLSAQKANTYIIMIRKNSLFYKLFRIKISSKSFFYRFMPLFCPEFETCPVCESAGNLKIHSYYKRYLIDFIDGKVVRHEITVTRVQCDSCGSTHAILPDFIIPYCSYSLFFILRVLGTYFLHLYSVEKICEKFSITLKQLYKWIALFRSHKAQWLGFLKDMEVGDKTFLNQLGKMIPYSDFASTFVSTFSFSFLQSHANPKTAVYCQHIFSPDYRISLTT